MTAIQKAREALEAVKQLTVGDRCPNWNTIAAVTQSRFAIANICDAALAALDAETPATPADVGEEPVAWQWRYRYDDGKWGDWQSERRPDAVDLLASNVLIAEERRPLYPATALERVVRERDEARARLQTAYQVKADMNDLANAERHARLIAEAKLAEARKVIEPFAERCKEGVRPDDGDNDGLTVKTVHLRAARRFLEETK